LQNIIFSRQFLIKFAHEDDQVLRMWAKKFSTDIEWALQEGVKFLKDVLLKKDMWAADILPLCKKGARIQCSLEWIQNELLVLERTIMDGSKKFFSLEDTTWWKTFFEEQRQQNASWMVQDRRLKTIFIWPILEIGQVTLRAETDIQVEEVDEAAVDLRVYE
jgi:hypothetical protein